MSVRYLVDDVDAAIRFATDMLDFTVDMHPGPGFASLLRCELRLLLDKPGGGGGAGQSMLDGSASSPRGWLRFQIEVPDIEATVAKLKAAGASLRSEIITGQGAASGSWSTTHPATPRSCSSRRSFLGFPRVSSGFLGFPRASDLRYCSPARNF